MKTFLIALLASIYLTQPVGAGAPEDFDRAVKAATASKHELAIRHYTRALQNNSLGFSALDLPVVYRNRGVSYRHLKQYDLAIADFDHAIRLDPRYVHAYISRGVVYTILRRFDRAIADYDQAILLDPEFAIAYRNRGDVYDALGQYERASEDYDKAIRFDPEYAKAYYDEAMDKRLFTAYHEAGHALLALTIDDADPLLTASIVPHGKTLGRITQLTHRDPQSQSLSQMKARLVIVMGGRVAEEVIFGKEKATTGAASDIERAIKLAREIVRRWGVSEDTGLFILDDDERAVLLSNPTMEGQNSSADSARRIDVNIRRLVNEGNASARSALQKMIPELHIVAEGLLEYESLSGDEILGLLNGKTPRRPKDDEAAPSDEPLESVPTTTYQYILLVGV